MRARARWMDGWMRMDAWMCARERGDRRDGRSSAREREERERRSIETVEIGPEASPTSRRLCVSERRERMTTTTTTTTRTTRTTTTTRTRERRGRWRRDGRTTVVSRGGETRREESDGDARAGSDGDARAAFELVTETIEIADGCAVRLVRPKSEDEVVDHYVAAGTLDSDPYWAALWPSATCVSRYLAKAPALALGKSVCDVGCGLGLAGLVACAVGARRVVMYDREPLAVACARLSIEANGFGDRASAEVFDWNRVDEQRQERFDAVLACDVMYEESAVAPVAELVPKLARGGGGRFLLGDPPRRAPRNRARFKSLLVEQYGAFIMRELTVTEGRDELVLIDFKL